MFTAVSKEVYVFVRSARNRAVPPSDTAPAVAVCTSSSQVRCEGQQGVVVSRRSVPDSPQGARQEAYRPSATLDATHAYSFHQSLKFSSVSASSTAGLRVGERQRRTGLLRHAPQPQSEAARHARPRHPQHRGNALSLRLLLHAVLDCGPQREQGVAQPEVT